MSRSSSKEPIIQKPKLERLSQETAVDPTQDTHTGLSQRLASCDISIMAPHLGMHTIMLE